MMNLDEKIAQLSDQQALSIVDSIAGEFAPDDMPEGRNEQASALTGLLQAKSPGIDVQGALKADTHAAAQAARELLKVMAEAPEMQASVETWLENPPVQETAPIPLLLAAPVVLTGCIVVLTLVGGTSIHRGTDGKWDIKLDPSKETPMNKNMVKIVKLLAGVMHVPHAS
jgi:hypothetical protein